MNRLDRQLAIVLLLQNRKSITAHQIAEYLEISVRTVYRDIQALSAAGIPIVSLPGEGYAVMEGYKLPPLAFDRDELLAFHVATELGVKFADRALRGAVKRVRQKIESLLPARLALDLEKFDEAVVLDTSPPPGARADEDRLMLVRQAIDERRRLRITDPAGAATEVAPMMLYFHGQGWLVVVRDEASGRYVDFPLGQPKKIEIKGRPFEPPEDFTFSRYWQNRQPALVPVA